MKKIALLAAITLAWSGSLEANLSMIIGKSYTNNGVTIIDYEDLSDRLIIEYHLQDEYLNTNPSFTIKEKENYFSISLGDLKLEGKVYPLKHAPTQNILVMITSEHPYLKLETKEIDLLDVIKMSYSIDKQGKRLLITLPKANTPQVICS